MDSTNKPGNVHRTSSREMEHDASMRISKQAQPLQDKATTSSLRPFGSRPRSWNDLSFSETSPHVPPTHHPRWLVEQCYVLKECRATKTVIDAQLQSSKTRWQQLRTQYRKSRNQFEASIDPFRPPNKSSVALRESLAHHQQVLEAYSTQVRVLRQTQKAAHQALDDCLKAFSEPIHVPPSRISSLPTTLVSTHEVSEQFVPVDLRTTAHTSTSTTSKSRKPSIEALLQDETMVQAGAVVKAAGGDAPTPLVSQYTTTMSPRQIELLEKYFHVAAEVQILGERLADHNYEYWDAVAGREYKEDQDEVLSIPGEVFEKGYHEERTNISQQLDDAIKEADRLYDECQKEDIDVEANRMARRDDQDASINEADYQEIFKESLNLIPPEAFNNAEVVRGGTPESDSEVGDMSKVKDSVSNWVENIPEGTESPV